MWRATKLCPQVGCLSPANVDFSNFGGLVPRPADRRFSPKERAHVRFRKVALWKPSSHCVTFSEPTSVLWRGG